MVPPIQLCIIISTLSTINGALSDGQRYDPTWDSLDKRPLPTWFDDAKIGIFLHWGVYSVPSFGSEWFWMSWKSGSKEYKDFMKENYPPGFTYQDFAKDFRAELFNPNEWAAIFQKSGAKYVVLTSKHHEGYTLWPSKYSFSWNAMDVGPNRDLLGELAAAVRKSSLNFGVYYSLFEWFNPLYLADKSSNFTTNNFVVNKIIPEMVELVQNYQPEVLWADGDWEANDTYWKSTEFLSWLYNESPVKDTVVVNDRWGKGTSCLHGDFYNCKDKYNPGVLQKHKWENAMALNRNSWGYRRNSLITDIYTTQEIIALLARTISCGGNLLIDVGPTPDGRIDYIFQDRLINLGNWLAVNGEAIYGSKPWKYQNDTVNPEIWYTSKNNTVYAIVLNWPHNSIVSSGSLLDLFKTENKTEVALLGQTLQLQWAIANKVVKIKLPDKATVKTEWGWVLKIKGGNSVETNDID